MKNIRGVNYRSSCGFSIDGSGLSSPDIFETSGDPSFCRPENGFVVSRDSLGNPLSLYGDDEWDFTPYRNIGDCCSAIIHFEKLPACCIGDAKWLIFVMLYMADSGRSTGLSISTVMGYMKAIRILSEYARSVNISLENVLTDEQYLMGAVQTIRSRTCLSSLAALITNLLTIGGRRTGIRVVGVSTLSKLKVKKKSLGEDNQHPVIPPRILSALVTQLNCFIDNVHLKINELGDFLNEIIKNEKFARSPAMQRKLGYVSSEFAPHFPEASCDYNLRSIFDKYQVNNLPSLSIFLRRTQHACRTLLHIYSGMRNAEALGLKVGCLVCERNKNGVIYKIVGGTTKLVGFPKSVSWVTSKDVIHAVETAEALAKIIGNYVGLPDEDTPLFISSGYLGLAGRMGLNGKYISVSNAGLKAQEIYEYLDTERFVIDQQDLAYLERLDHFRAWQSEDAFNVGQEWRFTTHQFRRSLAFYVSQSSLVSLPSLKRQLKHISREMTIYYCQSTGLSDAFNGDDHISRLLRNTKPEVDALAYLYEVILSDESLYGAHGKFVEINVKGSENIRILSSQRDDLIRKFKKGEIAYKETPLGACTTIEPCNKKALRSISACISCSGSIIKLSKLDHVIERQSSLVKELKALDPESMEFRMEKSELESLVNYRKHIAN